MATPDTNVEAPAVVNVINESDTDAIEDLLGGIPEVIKESKAGYKTTEFWLVIATAVLTVVDGIPLPEKYEGLVATALVIAYALSRGLAKKGIPDVQLITDKPSD